jgi:hypothetical protein
MTTQPTKTSRKHEHFFEHIIYEPGVDKLTCYCGEVQFHPKDIMDPKISARVRELNQTLGKRGDVVKYVDEIMNDRPVTVLATQKNITVPPAHNSSPVLEKSPLENWIDMSIEGRMEIALEALSLGKGGVVTVAGKYNVPMRSLRPMVIDLSRKRNTVSKGVPVAKKEKRTLSLQAETPDVKEYTREQRIAIIKEAVSSGFPATTKKYGIPGWRLASWKNAYLPHESDNPITQLLPPFNDNWKPETQVAWLNAVVELKRIEFFNTAAK